MPALCRDCLQTFPDRPGPRCPSCRSPRVLAHPELFSLSVAHLDCDAFYASVEKRDDPSLREVPLIVGGGKRGVVSTCCYIARIKGVRSAMPMFQALKLCPEAVVIPPRFEAYTEASRAIRAMMEGLTPSVEPLSLDEAFLDLTGTQRLHHAPPALLLARLLKQVETELGLTASVGLSHNKFLAKLASDMDKPRGFSVIGRAETLDLLAPLPVRRIWGVGPALAASLEKAGVTSFADLRRWERKELHHRFGNMGERLWHLSRGEDSRRVSPHEPLKTISHETTFLEDTSDPDLLDGHIWRLAEKVSSRAKARDMAGRVVVLKLKRADFTLISRRHALQDPTQLADRIWREARVLFDALGDRGPYRLIGVGISDLCPATIEAGDLLDPGARRREGVERAADAIRARFGKDAILKGRALR